ncbi:hypothetical protein NQ315_004532 [Exocentrus adspersus]|uniref:THAP-type domain-containing protein n=1 Tax=Exocentrus adspersus TaxID=1586481 RepID=A0AAV8V5I3_9CUCU|nr:hypothetical protein NQ315_004532 [Exocentrus adspersus]
MVYKWCVVPKCRNTSISSPHKLFVSVPTNPKRRKRWLELSRRDPKGISPQSNVFMCEDHFDMRLFQLNFIAKKIGKGACLTLNLLEKCFLKGKELVLSQNATETHADCLQKDENMIQQEFTEREELPKTQDKETITDPIVTVEKSVQVTRKLNIHYRSKAVQTRCQNRSISTSPLKVSTTTSFTSPFKEPCRLEESQAGVVKLKRNIVFESEKSDSDISCFESGNLSFVASSSSRITDSDSNVTDTNEGIEQLQCLKNTTYLIEKKPLMYVGISKECYFLIQLLHKHTNAKIEHILLCLKKIRLNSTFSELEDNFGLSLSYASKLFLRNIPIISSFLRPFIVNLDRKLIKKRLPIAFRHNYHNVSCIIDCLEIDIQKPSKALHQALTWSEYKKGNTVKYLISCTPNGLVNYVSQGTSDVTIVENCNFLDGLQQGTCILADRGFKHLEQILHEKGMKLLRPPSVNAGAKLTKTEVRQTKIIASLRIHIERVIRRLREFHMLKQHSVINTNILRVLDHVIIIACGLINLQDSLIK